MLDYLKYVTELVEQVTNTHLSISGEPRIVCYGRFSNSTVACFADAPDFTCMQFEQDHPIVKSEQSGLRPVSMLSATLSFQQQRYRSPWLGIVQAVFDCNLVSSLCPAFQRENTSLRNQNFGATLGVSALVANSQFCSSSLGVDYFEEISRSLLKPKLSSKCFLPNLVSRRRVFLSIWMCLPKFLILSMFEINI